MKILIECDCDEQDSVGEVWLIIDKDIMVSVKLKEWTKYTISAVCDEIRKDYCGD